MLRSMTMKNPKSQAVRVFTGLLRKKISGGGSKPMFRESNGGVGRRLEHTLLQALLISYIIK